MTDRVYDRVPLNLEVEYRTAGAFLVAYTANLSKGGLFIETSRPLTVGTDLLVKFSVPDSGPIEVRGHVAWIRPTASDGKPAGMGVEFEHLDARHGEMIDHVVAGFRGLSILIIACGVTTRALLGRSIRSILSSADVIEAEGAEAAEALFARHPDMLIVDLDDVDAGENLYAIRRAKTTSAGLPIIATARDEETRQRAREIGADEALSTPLVMGELQASMLRLLGKPTRIG